MEAVIKSEYGTRSRAAVFSELCRILLGEKHEFEEVHEKPKEEGENETV